MQKWIFSKHPIFKYDFWEKTWYSNMNFWCLLFTPGINSMFQTKHHKITWAKYEENKTQTNRRDIGLFVFHLFLFSRMIAAAWAAILSLLILDPTWPLTFFSFLAFYIFLVSYLGSPPPIWAAILFLLILDATWSLAFFYPDLVFSCLLLFFLSRVLVHLP